MDDKKTGLSPVDGAAKPVHDEPTHPDNAIGAADLEVNKGDVNVSGPPVPQGIMAKVGVMKPEDIGQRQDRAHLNVVAQAQATPVLSHVTAETRNTYYGTVMADFDLLHKANYTHYTKGDRLDGIDENLYHGFLTAQAPISWDR